MRGKVSRRGAVHRFYFLAPKLATTTRETLPRIPETVKTHNRKNIIRFTNRTPLSSSPALEPNVELTQLEEEAEYCDGEMGDSMPPQTEIGADDERGRNHGDAEHPDEAGNADGNADVTATGSAGEEAEPPHLPLGELLGEAQGGPPQSTGASSEQFFNADASRNRNTSQDLEYPASHEEGHGYGEEKYLGQQQQEHQVEGAKYGSPASPAGFGVEDDTAQQSARDRANGFDAGGLEHVGGELENGAMYPNSAQDPGGHLRNSDDHNDGDVQAGGMEVRKGFGESGDDGKEGSTSESRSRRMFDGSRVAERDDNQIVDAGEGADVIPGVDDLPVFANDQSKALNDETKVRKGWRQRRQGLEIGVGCLGEGFEAFRGGLYSTIHFFSASQLHRPSLLVCSY